MNVVQPETSYSAGFVDGGFLDQTILDNMNICMYCKNFNYVNYCVMDVCDNVRSEFAGSDIGDNAFRVSLSDTFL
jgi:hypothetical protein